MPSDKKSDPHADVGRLPTRDYERLLELVAPFEEACAGVAGNHTLIDIAPFVPQRDDPLYQAALTELVKIALEYRWRHKHGILLEDYLKRYPELGAAHQLPVHLILDEYRVRHRFGDRPAVETYRERFPVQFAELQRLVAAEPEPTVVPAAPLTESASELAMLLAGRFELQQELGRGGMGVVYKAYDHKHKRLVALKTMTALDPMALLRFNNEFRALVDITHPNLVSLYELAADGERRFFTMELVAGTNLFAHVREAAPLPPGRETVPEALTDADSATPMLPIAAPLTAEQLTRLRHVLGQLTAGILALHDAGKLHRDVKPSNVMVTPAGRVKLLDFGLAAEMDPGGLYQSTDPHILGTVGYMAPEQAASLPLSPATDWYAVGVMLFEALTGRLPFEGRPLEVLMAKQSRDAPAPRDLVPDVPDDLNALAVDLLRRDPAARPLGRAILTRLGRTPEETVPTSSTAGLASPFVGRQRHLQVLTEAYHEVLRGRPVTLYVHGRSGAGKTALVQHFLDDLLEDGAAVVLRGRCYEQESVPYKALDSVIDALSRHLHRLPTLEAQALLPRDVAALARVFPVLRRVPAVASAPRRDLDVTDPQELRRRATTGLRELLGRLGDARHLVIAIDDLQWGDTDSAALLLDLIRPPDAPAMLLLGCYRREDAPGSACLKALLKPPEGSKPSPWRELIVEPLTREEGRELAMALLSQAGEGARRQAESIARESGGSPFFVYELVHHFQASPELEDASGSPVGDVTLNEVLWSRIVRLAEPLRRLLEVVAVAGRPLRVEFARRAAAWEGDEHDALAYLRMSRLLRTTGPADAPLIETYHDRIRETVVNHLDPEDKREHHRRLAEVLAEASGIVFDEDTLKVQRTSGRPETIETAGGMSDYEVLAVHYQGAGLDRKAAHFYALAAGQAAEAVAFDYAARLYRLALELGGDGLDAEYRRRLRVRLADALANAGRGGESAREYRAAVEGASEVEARELQRRAAMQLLMSGQVDEGLSVMERVMNAVGMKLPPAGSWRVFLGLVFRRVQLMLRGLSFRERPESEVSPDLLARVNVCWAASSGLSMVDPFQGAYFQTRGVLMALQAGEPYHIARALAMEAAHESIGGNRSRRRTKEVLMAARKVAARVRQPYVDAWILQAHGTAAALAGQWPRAVKLLDRAEKLYRDKCTGVAWELGTVHRFTLWPLFFMGDVPEIAQRLPRLLKEAQDRDNLYSLTTLCLVIRSFLSLARDDPERAREELGQVMVKWSRRGYHVQHMNRMFDECRIDLYEGKAQAAWERLMRDWPLVERSQLLLVQQVRVFLRHLRASCALALARSGGDAPKLLAIARRDARSLQGEGAEWATALGLLLEAAVLAPGLPSRDALRRGLALCQKTSMHLYAAAAMRQLAKLGPVAERPRWEAEAARIFAEREVQNPARMSVLLVPGFPD